MSGAIAAVPVTLKVPLRFSVPSISTPKGLVKLLDHILQMQIQRRDRDRDRFRRALVHEGGVGLIQRDRSDLELKTRRRRRRRRRGLHGFALRSPALARHSPRLARSCALAARRRSAASRAHQRLETQLPVALAPNEQMHPVALHFGDRRLARRQVELSDRDAEIFPLHRLFFFVRRIDFEIRDRDARRLRVHVEMIAREMRLHVGLRAELARRHRRRQKLLRERLQRRQIDLVDRHVGGNLRLREIQRASHRERAAAVNVACSRRTSPAISRASEDSLLRPPAHPAPRSRASRPLLSCTSTPLLVRTNDSS